MSKPVMWARCEYCQEYRRCTPYELPKRWQCDECHRIHHAGPFNPLTALWDTNHGRLNAVLFTPTDAAQNKFTFGYSTILN